MRMRRNKVIGVAAAALAVTACGIAASNSGGIPGRIRLRCQRGTRLRPPRSPTRRCSPRSSVIDAAGRGSRGAAARHPGHRPGDARPDQASSPVTGRGSCRGAAAAGGPVTGHWPAGPCQGQAGRRAARRAAGPGQVSARAVPVAARAAGTRPWRVPRPGRPPARFTASAGRVARSGWRAERGFARQAAPSAGPQRVAAPCAGWFRRRRAPRPAAAPAAFAISTSPRSGVEGRCGDLRQRLVRQLGSRRRNSPRRASSLARVSPPAGPGKTTSPDAGERLGVFGQLLGLIEAAPARRAASARRSRRRLSATSAFAYRVEGCRYPGAAGSARPHLGSPAISSVRAGRYRASCHESSFAPAAA